MGQPPFELDGRAPTMPNRRSRGERRCTGEAEGAPDAAPSVPVVAPVGAFEAPVAGARALVRFGCRCTPRAAMLHSMRPATLLVLTLLLAAPTREVLAAPVFVSQWGSLGTGAGRFNRPHTIAVGPDGSVFVGDTNNQRIQKFDGSGKQR